MLFQKVKNHLGLTALLLVILIDGLGASMVLPILPDLFTNDPNHLTPFKNIENNLDWYYSIALGIFPLSMFFGAPFLGRLSDFLGRKVTIEYCLIGTCFGYLICGIGIELGNVWLFISGRLLDGITAGSLPIAQALLIESRTQVSKQSNIGLALFFAATGYMVGPVLGGSLGNLTSFFTPSTLPLYLVALLSFLCLLVMSLVNEQKQIKNQKINLSNFLSSLIPSIKGQKFFFLISIFTFYQLAWTGFFQYFSKYLFLELGFSSNQIAILLSVMGLGMCISFCYLVGRVNIYLTPKQIILFCGFSILIGFSLILYLSSIYLLLGFCILVAIAYGLGYPNIVTLLSSYADEKSQGFIFGLAASISSLSAFVTAICGGITQLISIKSYLWINTSFMGISLICSLLLFSSFLAKRRSSKEIIGEK